MGKKVYVALKDVGKNYFQKQQILTLGRKFSCGVFFSRHHLQNNQVLSQGKPDSDFLDDLRNSFQKIYFECR